MLAFLEKLTLSPAKVTTEDMRALRDAGLSDRAIEEGIMVCFLFSVMDRLADAFGFDIPPEALNKRVARVIDIIGYRPATLGH